MFKENVWGAFKALPMLNSFSGLTVQSVWREGCLYVVKADMRYDMMYVRLVDWDADYDSSDLKDVMKYLLIDLKKHYDAYGVVLDVPTEWEKIDGKYNEFGIREKEN